MKFQEMGSIELKLDTLTDPRIQTVLLVSLLPSRGGRGDAGDD